MLLPLLPQLLVQSPAAVVCRHSSLLLLWVQDASSPLVLRFQVRMQRLLA